MRPISAASVALGGLNRQLQRFELAAAGVTEMAATPNGLEPVHISSAARGAGETLDTVMSSGLEGAMVDLRISKYLAIANLSVLRTTDEVSAEAAKIRAPAGER